MSAGNRNEICVRARRDSHPQNLPKTFRKETSKPEHQPVPVRETNMRFFLLIAAAVLSFPPP
jgi:hypothetical protein